MSHNVPRARLSKAAAEAQKQKEKAKLEEYLKLTEAVFSRRKENDYSHDAFDSTTRLLQVNPELYTIWNYRRRILLHSIFPSCSPEQINDHLSTDLDMTTAALKVHPKVYWIWNHRRWCLLHVPEKPASDGGDGDPLAWRKKNWDRELFVVERMLDADARNFHAWNYRRIVLASMPVRRSDVSELAYTTKKIESSFSNFSAWHQRTKVLAEMWKKGAMDEATSREQEFEFVQNALWTDPADQSAWLYHRWLIGAGTDAAVLEREIENIQALLDEQPDSKWCTESLVRYKRLLLALRPERTQLVGECKGLLETLKGIDPMRRRRYEELGADLHA